MLDGGRHMQDIDKIKRLIDALALLKFNKFHWHLTDDQGWRFQSDRYPLLNTVSAVRPYSDFGKAYIDEPYGRAYTKDEPREIVSYCTHKGIDVDISDVKNNFKHEHFKNIVLEYCAKHGIK